MDIFTKEFCVRYSETGMDGRLKPVQIFQYFQDAASEHAYEMGVSALHLMPKKRYWVVLRYGVDVVNYPVWNETIVLKTRRHAHKNLYELREFDVCDAKGGRLFRGKTSWVMMDVERKKPVRLSRNMPERLINDDAPIADDLMVVSPLERIDYEKNFHVRRRDLDLNAHVNNTVYVEWALETGPETVVGELLPSRIAINYLADVGYGDMVRDQAQMLSEDGGEPVFAHRISRKRDAKELTRLQIAWRNFEERG